MANLYKVPGAEQRGNMIYCINPSCAERQNLEDLTVCASCGTPLIINGKLRLIRPLVDLKRSDLQSAVFEVIDDQGNIQILKVASGLKRINQLKNESEFLFTVKHCGLPKVNLDAYFILNLPNFTKPLHCLLMEKIEGKNLKIWLEENGIISQEKGLKWLKEIIEIVGAIHKLHFFNLDIKPDNIILRSDETLALIDFGTVREVTPLYLMRISAGLEQEDLSELEVGVVGSSGYMAPEQLNGKVIPQSDYYSIACVFLYLFTGLSPDRFKDYNTHKLHWREYAPHVEAPLADLLDQMLAVDIKERPLNALLLLKQIQDVSVLLDAKSEKYKNSKRLIYDSVQRNKILTLRIFGLISLIAIVSFMAFKKFGASFYYNLAAINMSYGDLELARQNYQHALVLNPLSYESELEIGKICTLQKQYDCAAKHYSNALKLNQDDWTIYYSLGSSYDDQKQYDNAIYAYRMAMSVGKDNAIEALTNLSRVYVITGQNSEAQRLIWRGFQILATKATKQKEARDYVKAVLYKNQAWLYLNMNKITQSRSVLIEALKLNHQNVAAQCLMAQVLDKINKTSEAIPHWENCFDLPSDLPEVEKWRDKKIKTLLK